ncbi:uncharacterized protein LOC120205588 [Hibiscus syriacus]|uniref:uncharacterized protein LOC120205588 n=1 Tax=Hibiscus syriacus TaxID=106335 RepID=UPI0019215DBB|nr:uncharacterized protein LOC120205588 [Hibiscus syriacus]
MLSTSLYISPTRPSPPRPTSPQRTPMKSPNSNPMNDPNLSLHYSTPRAWRLWSSVWLVRLWCCSGAWARAGESSWQGECALPRASDSSRCSPWCQGMGTWLVEQAGHGRQSLLVCSWSRTWAAGCFTWAAMTWSRALVGSLN